MEYLRICDKANRIARTPFLSFDEQEIVREMTKHYDVRMFGGFTNSERQRVIIIPNDTYEEPDFEVDVLFAKCDNQFYKIGHSDVLGALMNLGIEREVTGDIVFADGGVYVAVTHTIAPFVISQLTRIGKAEVSFTICEHTPERNIVIDEFEVIMASRRLDIVVSHLAKCSRSEAQFKIQNKEVKINGFVITKIDKSVPDNSIISVRKTGRFVVYGEIGKTKKENIVMRCGKYV